MTSLLHGRGLFSGCVASVTLHRALGRVSLAGLPLSAYAFVPSLRTTAIAPKAPEIGRKIATVEHLLAALGGLAIHDGVAIDIDGDELPLLDGAAARWCSALDELGVPSSPSRLVIAREGTIHVGASTYAFAPGGAASLAVTLDYPAPHLVLHAAWNGDAGDFARRIAPARTFVFAHEIAALADRGMMAHVDPESVVVVDEHGLHAAGAPAAPDEAARHKLLDLVGDLFLHGGVPEGHIDAFRPGHAATHEAIARARVMGIVVDR